MKTRINEMENLKITLDAINSDSDTRKITLDDVVNYTDNFNYVEIEVSCIVAASMISMYGAKLKVNGGLNNGMQLGWITKLGSGNYSVTCH